MGLGRVALILVCLAGCSRPLARTVDAAQVDAPSESDGDGDADALAAPDAPASFSDAVPQVPPGILFVECIGMPSSGFMFDQWCTPKGAVSRPEAYCHGIPDLHQLHLRASRPDLIRTGQALRVGMSAEDVFEVSVVTDYGQDQLFVAKKGEIVIDHLGPSARGYQMAGRLENLDLIPVGYSTGACRVVSMPFDVH